MEELGLYMLVPRPVQYSMWATYCIYRELRIAFGRSRAEVERVVRFSTLVVLLVIETGT